VPSLLFVWRAGHDAASSGRHDASTLFTLHLVASKLGANMPPFVVEMARSRVLMRFVSLWCRRDRVVMTVLRRPLQIHDSSVPFLNQLVPCKPPPLQTTELGLSSCVRTDVEHLTDFVLEHGTTCPEAERRWRRGTMEKESALDVYFTEPNYARGFVFTSSLADTLLASTLYEAHNLSLVRRLGTSSKCVLEMVTVPPQLFVSRASSNRAVCAASLRRCDVVRCDAMRCDAMRCDAMRCDAMRCDAMRCDAMRFKAAVPTSHRLTVRTGRRGRGPAASRARV
jgi:pentapeptide MXKDX repeat protein